MDEDDDPGAKVIWCVLESPGCPVSAAETRFTTKGRQRRRSTADRVLGWSPWSDDREGKELLEVRECEESRYWWEFHGAAARRMHSRDSLDFALDRLFGFAPVIL